MIGPRVRASAALLFVFGAGILLGAGFERHRTLRVPAQLSLLDEHRQAMDELREFLELDEAQLAAINAIVEERQELVDQMWEQFRPEVQSAMQQVHSDIAAVLRPDQVERFHAWLGRHRPAGGALH